MKDKDETRNTLQAEDKKHLYGVNGFKVCECFSGKTIGPSVFFTLKMTTE